MKLLVIAFFLFSLLYPSLFAQQPLSNFFEKKFSQEIENELSEGKLRTPQASYHYTYIGNYQKAINEYSLWLHWGLDSTTTKDSLDFLKYKPTNALEYLKDNLKEEQLVLISEAHQMPQHRIFTRDLLETLYKNGFRHLGMETLRPNSLPPQYLFDSTLVERGYPLNNRTTGSYMREPQMGNLVREALRLGFKIFAYESMDKEIERDLRQTMNVEQYLKAHPGEKVVLHCGWYHAIESDYPKTRKGDTYLAHNLKNSTGIDPFTIYQDALSERFVREASPYYNMTNTDEVSVLIDQQGNIFNGVEEKSHFDLFIYHPPTRYIKNRPNWLLKPGENKFIPIKKNKIAKKTFPIIIEAIPYGEEENSVPVDIIELLGKEEETQLILENGTYTIRITDINRTIDEYRIRVR